MASLCSLQRYSSYRYFLLVPLLIGFAFRVHALQLHAVNNIDLSRNPRSKFTRLFFAVEQTKSIEAAETNQIQDRASVVQKLLERSRELGPIGMDRSESERQDLLEQAKALVPFSDDAPARLPLLGPKHALVYSASPGGSSGKMWGPLVGKVTQEFVNEKTFYNAVELGPLKIALRAEREIKNDKTIKVVFRETIVSLFGKEVVRKEVKGSGVWKYLFAGEIVDEQGRRKLVRVMETPSLFVLEQPL